MAIGCSQELHPCTRPLGDAKEPTDLVLSGEKVSAKLAPFENEVSLWKEANTEMEAECRGSVWEAETESSEGSEPREQPSDHRELAVHADCQEGRSWEAFDLDNDRIISEDVLPTILEDDVLQVPLLTARTASMRNSWGVYEVFDGSLQVLSSVAAGVGNVAEGMFEATNLVFSCSFALLLH
ncbi:unnamed protein product [Effrenium voratum]|nr:unnamed protein product [Effrenium voratum]